MTNRFMHGWTRPHHSHQFSFLHQVSPTAWRCFCLLQLCIPVIYPCTLLSANTFTFLVLLSNKRGGMRRDLLTLLKQTSWTPSAEEPPPPSLSPAVNSANRARMLLHSARQQCRGFVPGYILFTSSLQRRPPDPGVSTNGSHPVWCPHWCRYQLIRKGIV